MKKIFKSGQTLLSLIVVYSLPEAEHSIYFIVRGSWCTAAPGGMVYASTVEKRGHVI